MARHHGGEHVKGGFFFNLDSWEMTTISGTEGGTLDGDASVGYLRVPVIAMLLVAPLLGAAFAIFLPFIGIALVAGYVALRAWNGVRGLAHSLVVTLGPAWHDPPRGSARREEGRPHAGGRGAPDAGRAGAGDGEARRRGQDRPATLNQPSAAHV